MASTSVIRKTTAQELPKILTLCAQAFPEEDLRPIVSALLEETSGVLSLAAFDGDAMVAHVLFTTCATQTQNQAGAILGPIGVLPSHQKQGLGGQLIRAGLKELQKRGIRQVFVLGDPGYYQRFDFIPERLVLPPYPLPDAWADAWQAMSLANAPPLAAGPLSLPKPWMQSALWGP